MTPHRHLSNLCSLGVVSGEQPKGEAGQIPEPFVREYQSPFWVAGQRQNQVANPAGAVGVDAISNFGGLIDNTAFDQDALIVAHDHSEISGLGKLEPGSFGDQAGRFIRFNFTANVDDNIGCLLDVHCNSSIFGGISPLFHPRFTSVVLHAPKLTDHQSDQSNSSDDDIFVPISDYCSDCAWPVECGNSESCMRRDLGDVRSRCPWRRSEVFQ